jgi:hypothetical protein
MTITIDIPEEVARQAAALGLSVGKYVERLIEQSAGRPVPPAPKALSVEEFKAILDRLARNSASIPSLSLSAFSRKNLYDDHD